MKTFEAEKDELKILVVDDHEQLREIIRDSLAYHGYEIEEAGDAEHAMDILGDITPDAVVLDVDLPGMSGHELCARMKENRRLADVPVIIMSGRVDLENRMMALTAGASKFLSKPFMLAELLNLVAFFTGTHNGDAWQADVEKVLAAASL